MSCSEHTGIHRLTGESLNSGSQKWRLRSKLRRERDDQSVYLLHPVMAKSGPNEQRGQATAKVLAGVVCSEGAYPTPSLFQICKTYISSAASIVACFSRRKDPVEGAD